MNVRIFTNFTLAPEMDIQTADNFALLPIPVRSSDKSPAKRTAEDALSDQPPLKKRRNKFDWLKQGVRLPMVGCGRREAFIETNGGIERIMEDTQSTTNSEEHPRVDRHLTVDNRVRVARYAGYKKELLGSEPGYLEKWPWHMS
jgi:hypothetical protein